jgi:hypothetical protein
MLLETKTLKSLKSLFIVKVKLNQLNSTSHQELNFRFLVTVEIAEPQSTTNSETFAEYLTLLTLTSLTKLIDKQSTQMALKKSNLKLMTMKDLTKIKEKTNHKMMNLRWP